MKPENVIYFDTAADFRAWLEKNHETSDFQWLAFPKKNSGRTGLPYAQAVEEALCFGWIDGQAGRASDDYLAVRFSKRRRDSIWSNVNVGRMNMLIEAGRVRPAGMRAFEARRPELTGVYSNEAITVELPPDLEAIFRANEPAWEFWNTMPRSYRRQMTWWVISAKREGTRRRRLDALIEEHAAGRRIDPVHMPRMSERP